MNRSLPLLAALLAAVTAGNAVATHPGQTGALPVPANRIVGLWKVDVAIGPCGGPPVLFFPAYNTYHAGGTLSDFNWISPTLRSPGQGVWRYQGRGRYVTRFQFFRYDNPPPAPASNRQDLRTVVTLDPDGNGYTAQVNAQVTTLDGAPVGPALCGQAVGTRVTL